MGENLKPKPGDKITTETQNNSLFLTPDDINTHWILTLIRIQIKSTPCSVYTYFFSYNISMISSINASCWVPLWDPDNWMTVNSSPPPHVMFPSLCSQGSVFHSIQADCPLQRQALLPGLMQNRIFCLHASHEHIASSQLFPSKGKLLSVEKFRIVGNSSYAHLCFWVMHAFCMLCLCKRADSLTCALLWACLIVHCFFCGAEMAFNRLSLLETISWA